MPIRKELRRGDSGAAVAAFQALLAGRGYIRTQILDDEFGDVMESAVMDFQEDADQHNVVEGIEVDGIVGAKTMEAARIHLGSDISGMADRCWPEADEEAPPAAERELAPGGDVTAAVAALAAVAVVAASDNTDDDPTDGTGEDGGGGSRDTQGPVGGLEGDATAPPMKETDDLPPRLDVERDGPREATPAEPPQLEANDGVMEAPAAETGASDTGTSDTGSGIDSMSTP